MLSGQQLKVLPFLLKLNNYMLSTFIEGFLIGWLFFSNFILFWPMGNSPRTCLKKQLYKVKLSLSCHIQFCQLWQLFAESKGRLSVKRYFESIKNFYSKLHQISTHQIIMNETPCTDKHFLQWENSIQSLIHTPCHSQQSQGNLSPCSPNTHICLKLFCWNPVLFSLMSVWYNSKSRCGWH